MTDVPSTTIDKDFDMKKFLMGLAALAASAFCMILPNAASAATVTLGGVACNNNNATWPTTQYWYCTPSGTQQGPLLSLLSNVGADAQTQFTSSGGQLYVFKNPADYFAFCGGGTVLACDATVGSNGEWGKTVYGSGGTPTYSVTLERDANGILNPQLNAVFMHELGHQIDAIYSGLGTGGTGFVSGDTTEYLVVLGKAWTKFNAAYTVQCGSGGLFRSQISAAGTYICNGSLGTGTGLNTGFSGNNESVLKQAWPNYFNSGSPYKELFAEAFAKSTNGNKTGNANPQYYILKDGLTCMLTIANTIQDSGSFPVPLQYPNYCR